MTAISYQNRAAMLQEAIFAYDYYVALYRQVLQACNVSEQDISTHMLSSDKLQRVFNKFFFALPDTKAIRRDPFFYLCDLCEEGMFDE